MTTEEGLLRAVQADPQDELPRLLLADWLDDVGDTPRAEFVRLQCELARGVADLGKRDELQERERRLMFEHADRWLGPFARTKPPVWRYERGTAVVSLTAEAVEQGEALAQAAEWFPRGWVTDARVEGILHPPYALFKQPWLGRLSSFQLKLTRLFETGATALADCTHLANLHTLSLVSAGVKNEVKRLSASRRLKKLKALNLTLEEVSLFDVSSLAGFKNLRRLNLSSCKLTHDHIDALTGTGWPKGLVSLQLAGCSMTPEAQKRLLSSPCLEGLEELNLGHQYVRDQGASWIASSPYLGNLRRLGLRRSSIGGGGAATIASSSKLPSLEAVDFWDSGVGRGSLEKMRDRFGKGFWFRPEEPPWWG